MNYDVIIKNGTVITAGEEYVADIGVKNGKIATIASDITGSNKIIDATDKFVFPGAIDIHTHINAPLHGSHTLMTGIRGHMQRRLEG